MRIASPGRLARHNNPGGSARTTPTIPDLDVANDSPTALTATVAAGTSVSYT